MEDLGYILNLGFSGTDVWRAVTLSFVLGTVSYTHLTLPTIYSV